MGKVWFSVFLALCLQEVLARDCGNIDKIKSCDECIRCGGKWCNSGPELGCSLGSDDWCPSHSEHLFSVEATDFSIVDFRPRIQSVNVGDSSYTQFIVNVSSEIPKDAIKLTFVNSTIKDLDPKQFGLTKTIKYSIINNNNKITIHGNPRTQLCPAFGSNEEYVTWKMQIKGIEKETIIKYHVPCACDCSKPERTEKKSPKCGGKGDYSCGVCSCQKGWTGSTCETKITNNPLHCDRGDISGCVSIYSDFICSNNGICTCGGNCDCDTSLPDSQYFDEQCTHICTVAGSCDACLLQGTIGKCEQCFFPMYINPFNKTLMDARDNDGRKVWIECTEKTDTCNIEYAAMKEDGNTRVMIVNSCNPVVAPVIAGPVDVTIPVILGVLALVAATAGVVGYMVWKNRAPPLPLADQQYTQMDAEDCTGENPLYKPPTSSFKNPTYGKW